jgi:Flp pilus assembly protein TadG
MERGTNRGTRASSIANRPWYARLGSECGQSLLETAIILPIVLLISVSIFEFGRMYQHIQVLTNAAREGARLSVLPASSKNDVKSRVTQYMQDGQLGNYAAATINVDQSVTLTVGAGTATGSLVTVNYPFSFMVLNPVAKLITSGSDLGKGVLTLTAHAEMRNEIQ